MDDFGRAAAAMLAATVVGMTGCERQTPADTPARAASTGATAAAPAAPAAAPAPQTAGTAVGPRVGVTRTPQYGAFLTDGNGRALYLLEEDSRDGSACAGMCAAIWPPFLAGQGRPTAADSAVRASLLGTADRPGGAKQVTYGGQPLYYYLGDEGPGQTRGQHVEDSWGEWRLVSPAGRGVGEDERGGRRRGRDRRGEDAR
jgi:predicted lipoprotein with Yx(FWY)xxD motif